MKQALGLVEISGLSTAVVVADTMAKAANIRILEIENTKGLGYMTIKITGDVGAVKAAVDAGSQIGLINGKLVSCKVIPRPSDYVESTFCKSADHEQPTPPEPPTAPPPSKAEKEPEETKFESAEPEAAMAEPEAVAVEPEAETGEPEAVTVEPEPAAEELKPEPEPEQPNEPEAKTEKKPTGKTGNSKRRQTE